MTTVALPIGLADVERAAARLRGVANRKDLTVRFFQFFDHHLKDAPAPKWMSEGVPYLKKDAKEPGK